MIAPVDCQCIVHQVVPHVHHNFCILHHFNGWPGHHAINGNGDALESVKNKHIYVSISNILRRERTRRVIFRDTLLHTIKVDVVKRAVPRIHQELAIAHHQLLRNI